jgi:hypothetical protein
MLMIPREWLTERLNPDAIKNALWAQENDYRGEFPYDRLGPAHLLEEVQAVMIEGDELWKFRPPLEYCLRGDMHEGLAILRQDSIVAAVATARYPHISDSSYEILKELEQKRREV